MMLYMDVYNRERDRYNTDSTNPDFQGCTTRDIVREVNRIESERAR
jgi:hypothetical protein